MKLIDRTNRLNADDRGVSPVIGVILMVAITVILAAVIGTFVLDLGQSAGQSAPSASLTVTADTGTNNVTISHKGGDGLADDRTRIVLTNETDGQSLTFEPGNTDEVFSVGNDVVINASTNPAPATIGSTGDVFSGRDAESGNFTSINSGVQYTVQIIDTDSQRVVYETTVTA